MNKIKKLDSTIPSLMVMCAIILVAMLILRPTTFYSLSNFQSICYLFPEYGIMTFGMMLCMILGGIDLSLVGIMNLSGVVAAYIMVHMGGTEAGTGVIILAIVAALVVGLVCGCFNGFMIGFLHIPAMLVTLCGLQLYTGLAEAITTGPGITGLPTAYIKISNGTFFGIPYTLPIFIVVTLVVSFLLKSTTYGQKVYYVGSNAEAARYSGINNLKVTIMTHMISGLLGSISGVLSSAHYGSAKSNYNTSYTLMSLLIVVLGGIHPDGGKGKVIGVTIAIILLQFVSTAFSILKIDTTINNLIYGALLIIILLINGYTQNRALKKK